MGLAGCVAGSTRNPINHSGEHPTVGALRLRDVLTIMEKLQFRGSWNELRGRLKQHYGNLTDDDLVFPEGKGDEFLGRLQKKLGKGKDELRKMIEGL